MFKLLQSGFFFFFFSSGLILYLESMCIIICLVDIIDLSSIVTVVLLEVVFVLK